LMTVGAATSALFYGLDGRSQYRDRVVRLTSLSAGLLGAGQWALQPSTDLIYHEGAIAMNCAALLAYPVLVPNAAINSIDTDLEDLGIQIDTVSVLQMRVLAADRADSTAALSDATTAREAGHALAARASTQPSVLLAHIKMLDAEVRQLLTSTAPNFQSLQAILAQLPAAAKTAGSDNLKPPAPASTASSGPRDAKPAVQVFSSRSALDALAGAVAKLRTQTSKMKFRLARGATATGSLDVLAKCKPKSSTRFAVAPDALAQDVNKTLTLVITDKGGFPSANVVGDNVAAVKLSPIELGTRGDEFKLTVTGVSLTTAADAKKPTLAIRSTSGLDGRNIVLNVTALAAPAAPSKKTDETPLGSGASSGRLMLANPGAPLTEYERALLTGDQIRAQNTILAVQCHLRDRFRVGRFAPNCILGNDTREAIRDANGGADAYLRSELVDAARKNFADGKTSRCDLPRAQRCNNKIETP
jgi:hypothetical protein